ncbi:MAG: NUDIX hydrolase [Oscillospiraceae bacterium]|nr:NUDIX hydrolase [Oscillospiraceae bacterium]
MWNNGKYLLLRRADNRSIAPGVWSGVGGHMEANEINDPLSACYREIEEETGIHKDQIKFLDLRYIITRRSKDEIRQSYIYFGETTQTEVIQTDEGELSWVSENELLNREYTKTFTAMLEHYISRKVGDRMVYVGVAMNNNGMLKMNWSQCEDFE